jgi:hypothetical protein
VDEVLHGQLGDRADPSRRVDEDGPVAEADRVRDVDRFEERSDLTCAYLRPLALDDGVPLGLDGRGGVDDTDMTVDQAVEESPQGRQVQLLGRRR